MTENSPLKVVCGLIVHAGMVLATRRDATRAFPLHWEFPGGKLEDGESAELALHREMEEELNFRVKAVKELQPVHYQENGHNICLLPFLCRPDQGHGPVPLDHTEIRWIYPECANRLTWAPADIPLVARLKELAQSINHE